MAGKAKAQVKIWMVLLSVAVPMAAQNATIPAQDPQALYVERCATCHEAGKTRAVSRAAMKSMSSENILFTLTKGSMKSEAVGLSSQQIELLSKFLSAPVKEQTGADNHCLATDTDLKAPFAGPHWNGWGADLEQHRFQPVTMARLQSDEVPRLKLKWAFGFPGVSRMYGQPAVINGRLFVGSAGRKVYSLSAKTGCIYWTFDTDFPVRTAVSVGPVGKGWAIYFGDQHANAYAVDAATGTLLWKTRVEEHPAAIITGAPILAEGKLFVPMSSYEEALGANPKYECCNFRGSLSALDAITGKILWKSYTVPEEPRPVRKSKQGVQLWGPSGVAVWSAPTFDSDKHLVYVATGDSYSDPATDTADAFLAFDANTGKLVWSKQFTKGDIFTMDCSQPPEMRTSCPEAHGSDADFGSSPILVKLANGRRALIAGQKSGIVHAVDPDRQGKILWERRLGQGGPLGGIQWGSAVDDKNIYVAVSDVQIRPATESTAGARKSILGMPLQLDPNAGGGIFALKLDTGEIVWQTPHPGCNQKPGCSPAQSAAVTAISGIVFSGGVDGHMRAYSGTTGKIVWDVDTEQEFATVNGVKSNGGSIDGPGAVVVDGVVYVNSGYGYLGHTPGNVLLAFSVDGK